MHQWVKIALTIFQVYTIRENSGVMDDCFIEHEGTIQSIFISSTLQINFSKKELLNHFPYCCNVKVTEARGSSL